MRMVRLSLVLLFLGLGSASASGQRRAAVAPPENQATKSGSDPDKAGAQEVVALEKRTWETAQHHDINAYANLLSDDFVLVNENGTSNKKQSVEDLKGITIYRYRLGDINVHDFSPNALMITYRVNVKLSFEGHMSDGVSYRSSLWVKRQGRWLNAFYQASDSR
jgi:hypothetical protein